MKILFMEKFDGTMAQVSNEVGRDPRMKVSVSGFTSTAYRVNSADGIYVAEDTMPSQGGSNRVVSAVLTLPARDPNKRYSLLLKGFSTFYRLWYYSARSESPSSYLLFRLGGVVFSSLYSTAVGEYLFPDSLLKLSKEEEVDIEIVQDGGKLYFYKNNILMHVVNGTIPSEILNISASSTYYYSHSGYGSGRWGDVRCSPTVKLKGVVFAELEEGEKRIGNVRLDSTIVSVDNATGLDVPSLNKRNYADENFINVGAGGITLRPFPKKLESGETIVHHDVRVAMTVDQRSTVASIEIKDLETTITEKTFSNVTVGLKHTPASACNVIPVADVKSLYNLTITLGPVI